MISVSLPLELERRGGRLDLRRARPSGGWVPLKIGVIIGANAAETAWNAFRFAVKALDSGHPVRAFLLGPGVECAGIRQGAYDVPAQMHGLCGPWRGAIGLRHLPALTSHGGLGPLPDLDNAGSRRPDHWADRVLTF